MNRPDGYEFFLTNLETFYLRFESQDLFGLSNSLAKLAFAPNERFDLEAMRQKWLMGHVSNFEYIIRLNIASGRSFRDPAAYPVFPPVLTELHDQKSLVKSYKKIESVLFCDFYFNFSKAPDELPNWAASKFEYVYLMRKALESQAVSRILHEWIDNVFGPKSAKLFLKPHPSRPARVFPDVEFHYKLPNRLKWAATLGISKEHGRFGFAMESFDLLILQLDFQGDHVKVKLDTVGTVDDDFTFISSHYILAHSQRKSSLVMVSEVNGVVSIPFYSETKVFASCGDLMVFSREVGELAYCKIADNAKVHLIAHVGGEITVVVVRVAFRMVACATIDGVLHAFDFKTGAEILKFATNEEVSFLEMTPGWGFLLAVSQQRIFLFTVNGELVKVVAATTEIRNLFVHESVSGTDGFSFVNDKNEIGVFEAFYPENAEIIGKVPANLNVVRICRSPLHNWFLIAFSDGTIRTLPNLRDLCV
jgi:hypothetical protein